MSTLTTQLMASGRDVPAGDRSAGGVAPGPMTTCDGLPAGDPR